MFVNKQAQFIPYRKFSTGSCKIDLYFPEHKLAIECDEHSVMIKMSLSVQCSVVEQFSFKGKKNSVSACQGRRVPCVKRCLHGNWIRGGKR